MKTTCLLLFLAGPLLLTQCNESRTPTAVSTAGDASFARSTFESLARGDSAVASKID